MLNPKDLEFLTEDEVAELDDLIGPEDGISWAAQDGPQRAAFESEADVIGYGGAAGGGKTDLICGLGLKKHKRVLIVRRQKDQTRGIVQRMGEIIGSTDGYSSQQSAWRLPGGTLIEFGGLDNPGDEAKWQGRPHDLKAFDEATEIRESQVRFIMGWNRSNDPSLHAQTLLTFNPPRTAEGQWVISFFAPWLDPSHPRPAVPGELRWFTTIGGKDEEVPDNRPFVIIDKQRVYDFDPESTKPEDVLRPRSRTFFPARVTDNKYYLRTGYVSVLQSMPEPLRSQMLYGDFRAGIKDDPWQIIPTKWVEEAMARWEHPGRLPAMQSMGVDVARGGDDMTVISRRHGRWFDELVCLPGADTPDGPAVAGQVFSLRRDYAVVHIDAIGVGASPYDFLKTMRVPVVGVNGSELPSGPDRSGFMTFRNKRTEMWWRMREALDPAHNFGICLPPDKKLLADLTAPLWSPEGKTIVMESRAEIIKRIGRSPDRGTAVCLAWMRTPTAEELSKKVRPEKPNHNPLDLLKKRAP